METTVPEMIAELRELEERIDHGIYMDDADRMEPCCVEAKIWEALDKVI